MSNTGVTSKAAGYKIARAIIPLLLLFTAFNAGAQEIQYNTDGTVYLKFRTIEDWEGYKKKILFLHYENKECDSLSKAVYIPGLSAQQQIISKKDSIITAYKSSINHLSDAVSNLQGELIDIQTKRDPIIKFEGFSTGIQTGYFFNDTAFTKSTFTTALIDNLAVYAKARIKIKSFEVSPILYIPFTNKSRSTGLIIEAGYIW